MAKKNSELIGPVKAVILAAAVFSVTGCTELSRSARISEVAAILSGALAWARQDWPASVSHFLGSLKNAEINGNARVAYYALYGLGSTYLSGDERRAAEIRFGEIGSEAPAEIVSSVWYQRGIIAYRDGDYRLAAQSFRRSIETGGAATDARVNMELSLRSLEESRTRASSGPSPAQTEPSPDSAADSIFNLIRKKEQDRWKNQASESAASGTVDY